MNDITKLAAMLGLWAAFVPDASATTIAPLSVEQMTDASDAIVRASVEDQWTDLDEEGRITTYVNIHVTEVVKGDLEADDYMTIETHGGILGDAISPVHMAARYSADEEVVLFLCEKRFGTSWGTVGLALGKYTVRVNPQDGAEMVVNFNPPWTVDYDARFIPNPPLAERVSLRSFEDRIRARVDLGWDGNPIPGVAPAHLRAINKLQPGVR